MTFWQGKKVLVTGASGFIGSRLTEALVYRGAAVTCTSRHPAPEFLQAVANKINLLIGNLDDPEFCDAATKNQDVVMNLSATVGGVEYNQKHHGSIFVGNMRSFINVLEASRKNHVERVLVVSSACVYPRDCTIPTPEDEGTLGTPEPTNAGYGWAKRMQEFLAQAYIDEFKMNIAVARPYNAYGPRDNFDPARSHVIPSIIRRIYEKQDPLVVWGDGEQTRAFLYVDDFVEGLILCTEKGVGKGPINIGTNEEISIKELVQLIVEISDYKPKIVFDTTKPSGQPRRNCDTRKSEETLGFRSKTSLSDGIKHTIDWYKSHRKHG